MNNLDIKNIRGKLGVSQEKFAEILGVHLRTIQNWESGGKIPVSKNTILRSLVDKTQKATATIGNSVYDQLLNEKDERIKDLKANIELQQSMIANQQAVIEQLKDVIDLLKGRSK